LIHHDHSTDPMFGSSEDGRVRMQPAFPLADASLANRPRSRLKHFTFRLLSVGLGIMAALILLEVSLRVAGWPAPGFYVNGAGPLDLRNAGRSGGAFPPNTHGELRHYDYRVECNVNSYGFRDNELVPRRVGEWRIGFLGDSFTAGIGVRQQDRFADVFKSEIQKSQPNVTVWNLGAPSCGTACEAEMLNVVKQSYDLDKIVLAFYGGNDLEDNWAWFADPTTQVGSQRSLTSAAKDWLGRHSRLATFLWINVIRGWATFRPPGVYNQSELNRLWPDTARSLQDLRKSAGSKPLTVLYLPATPEWNDTVWQLMRSRYQITDENRYLVRDAVAEWSRREGVDFLDATDWLKECQPQSGCVLPVDPHWTASAHLLIAKHLLTEPKWVGTRQ
jgi:hypothetical protein